jgi:hypothetical protein
MKRRKSYVNLDQSFIFYVLEFTIFFNFYKNLIYKEIHNLIVIDS